MKDNLLINETSLYLLQHAQNPVNWESWTDNAFKKGIFVCENQTCFPQMKSVKELIQHLKV